MPLWLIDPNFGDTNKMFFNYKIKVLVWLNDVTDTKVWKLSFKDTWIVG